MGGKEEACSAYGKLKPKINATDLSWLENEKDNRVKGLSLVFLKTVSEIQL